MFIHYKHFFLQEFLFFAIVDRLRSYALFILNWINARLFPVFFSKTTFKFVSHCLAVSACLKFNRKSILTHLHQRPPYAGLFVCIFLSQLLCVAFAPHSLYCRFTKMQFGRCIGEILKFKMKVYIQFSYLLFMRLEKALKKMRWLDVYIKGYRCCCCLHISPHSFAHGFRLAECLPKPLVRCK